MKRKIAEALLFLIREDRIKDNDDNRFKWLLGEVTIPKIKEEQNDSV
ncbi:hypothetical protein ABEW34_21400 [Paenibacillus algorifonticola]